MVVVFFSRAGENYEVGEVTVGNTAKLAQEVARRTDSPMIEIARTEPLSGTVRRDLRNGAGGAACQRASAVHAQRRYRCARLVRYRVPRLSDLVRRYADAVYAFLESRDWSGKTIYPFCTHGGSGLGRTPERIAAITKTTVKPGLAVMGTDAQNNASKAAEAVSGWIAKSGL